jgi:hypothetical protein
MRETGVPPIAQIDFSFRRRLVVPITHENACHSISLIFFRNSSVMSTKASIKEIPPKRSTQPAVVWRPKRELGRHEWLAVGRRLGEISRCNQWWLGDWVRYGTEKWGEKYTRAARITGYDPRSLANMASISAAFQPSRRRDNLTWSHHATVVALPQSEQEVWLDRAATERLSVADLRTELRAPPRRRSSLSGSPGNGPVLAGGGNLGDVDPASVLCPQCGYRLKQGDLGADS